MKQLYPFVALAMLLAGGWFFFTQFQVQKDGSLAKRPPNSPIFPSGKRSSSSKPGTSGAAKNRVGEGRDGGARDVDPRDLDRSREGDDRRDTRSTWSASRDRVERSPGGIGARSTTRPDEWELEARRRRDGEHTGRDAAFEAGRDGSRASDSRGIDSRDYDSSGLSRTGWNDPRRDANHDDRRPTTARDSRVASSARRPVGQGRTIRIASFNIQVFGDKKVSDPGVVAILAAIVRQFDVVAIQEIRTQSDDLMPRFLQRVNETGRRYRHVIGPREGRTDSTEQYAFVFDADTIAVDPQSVYRIDDPDDLLHRPPFAAGFACVNAPRDEAFTFTLVNVHTDPDEAKAECDVLDDVFRAVQGDGRGEDDVILLGDFNAAPRQMQHLSRMANARFAIGSQPTNTRGDKTYDNLIFDGAATREATGRTGVYDFLRAFNLRGEREALAISDHMPVWAEFSVLEAGDPHHVARARY